MGRRLFGLKNQETIFKMIITGSRICFILQIGILHSEIIFIGEDYFEIGFSFFIRI